MSPWRRDHAGSLTCHSDRGKPFVIMARLALLHVVSLAFLASCAGAFEPSDSAGRRGANPRARPDQQGAPPAFEVASVEVEREGIPLEDCRRFERFVELREWYEPMLRSMHEIGPEWRTNGYVTDVGKDGRMWIAWAEGYTVEDDRAEQPRPHPWSACALPHQLTADIPDLSYGASPMVELGLLQVSLLDEASHSEGARPRREFETVVDLRSARVLPRSLCYLSSDLDLSHIDPPPPGIGCQAKRECDVNQKTGAMTAGKWQAVGTGCEDLLERGSTDADRGFGTWKLTSHRPSDWL